MIKMLVISQEMNLLYQKSHLDYRVWIPSQLQKLGKNTL